MVIAFWSSFWPNLAATLIGLVVGVPLALWVNRQLLRRTELSHARAQARQLVVALAVVADALRANALSLGEVEEGHRRALLTKDPEFDLATWKAVSSQLSQHLHNPDLIGRVTFHFARVEALGALIVRYGHHEFERRDHDHIREEIIQKTGALASEAESLSDELDQAAADVDTSGTFPRRTATSEPMLYLGRPVRDFDEIDAIRGRGR